MISLREKQNDILDFFKAKRTSKGKKGTEKFLLVCLVNTDGLISYLNKNCTCKITSSLKIINREIIIKIYERFFHTKRNINFRFFSALLDEFKQKI